MKSLVTGATGFVGRRLVRSLSETYGPESLACLAPPIDNELERSGRANLARIGIEDVHTADILTWEAEGTYDVVYHLAATTDSGARDHRVNDEGTANLIHGLGEGLRGKRFVYVSTTAAIDRVGPATNPVDESTPCRPKTEYGRSKVRGEAIVRKLSSKYGYDWTILRYATVYGHATRDKGLFDHFSSWVRKGNLLGRFYFPGRTGLVHVDDAVRITHELSVDLRAVGQTICVVAESPPVGEISQAMARSLGVKLPPIRIPTLIWNSASLILRTEWFFKVCPAFLHNHLWRLSLIVDDRLWVSGRKLWSLYPEPLIQLDEGIRDVMGLPRAVVSKIHITHSIVAD